MQQTNLKNLVYLDISEKHSELFDAFSKMDDVEFYKRRFIIEKDENIYLILADYIVSTYQEEYLTKMIKINYPKILQSEKKEILLRSIILLKTLDTSAFLADSIENYYKNNEILSIDGFINFRTYEYKNLLSNVIDKVYDEYLTEKEYKNFINLLKIFVNVQTPEIDTLHIIALQNGEYDFYDNQFNNITKTLKRDFEIEVDLNDLNEIDQMNEDDFLISTLIALTPAKIILHNANIIMNKELLNTIHEVFKERVEIINDKIK